MAQFRKCQGHARGSEEERGSTNVIHHEVLVGSQGLGSLRQRVEKKAQSSGRGSEGRGRRPRTSPEPFCSLGPFYATSCFFFAFFFVEFRDSKDITEKPFENAATSYTVARRSDRMPSVHSGLKAADPIKVVQNRAVSGDQGVHETPREVSCLPPRHGLGQKPAP